MKIKTMLLAAAIVCALAACKKDAPVDAAPADAAPADSMPADTAPTDAAPTDTAPAPTDAAPTDPAAAPTDATAAPAADAAAMDGTGVKECDDYLTKYMACLNDKVPAASRAAMQQGIDQMRSGWKAAAATPAGKASLAQACTTASESAKASMKAFGCEM
jgi:hypothetical protein